MRRSFTTIFLLLSLCLQTLAHAGMGVVMGDAQAQAHARMHFESQSHHHDEHGGAVADGIHEDRSAASVHHLATDCGVHALALTACVDLRLPQLPPEMPAQTADSPPRPPCLAGLERPPKTLA